MWQPNPFRTKKRRWRVKRDEEERKRKIERGKEAAFWLAMGTWISIFILIILNFLFFFTLMLIGRCGNVQSEYLALIYCIVISWDQNTLDHVLCPFFISVFFSLIFIYMKDEWVLWTFMFPRSAGIFILRHPKQKIRLTKPRAKLKMSDILIYSNILIYELTSYNSYLHFFIWLN